MSNRSLIHLLKNKVRKYVFGLFFALIGCSFVFHVAWTLFDQKNKENEIKKFVVKSLQEPLRKKAFLDIKNIITGYNLPNSQVAICLKLKDGLSLTDGNCDKARYEKAEIAMIDDYFYISINKKFNWEVVYSYLALFLIGFLVFYWTREKLTMFSKSVVSDLDNITTSANSHHFHYDELKALHVEVKKGHHAIQKAEELKRKEELWKLTTKFAHDIRCPLSVIKKLETDLEYKSNKESQKLFSNAIQSINSLVSDLLYRYRNPVKKQQLNPPSSEIVGVIKSCLSSISVLNRNIKINFSNRGAKTIFAKIPVSDLERTINNILKNSSEATPNKIDISCSCVNGLIIISIEDDGIGIPQKIIKHVFEEKTTSGKKDGNGLGLSIAKDLMEKANGKIELESQQGVGTKVILSLPASYLENGISDSTAVLIDDSDLIKRCWQMWAKKQGHHLVVYENYDQLFKNLDAHNKDDFFFCDDLIGSEFKGLNGLSETARLGF